MFASVSAHVWAAPAFVCLKIVHARICTGFCVLQQKTHTGVIQNRNYVPCYGCSSVIFPLIKRAVHRTLASAFSISPWSREEMVSVHLSVFIHFFWPRYEKTQCLFKIIFFILLGFLQPKMDGHYFSCFCPHLFLQVKQHRYFALNCMLSAQSTYLRFKKCENFKLSSFQ